MRKNSEIINKSKAASIAAKPTAVINASVNALAMIASSIGFKECEVQPLEKDVRILAESLRKANLSPIYELGAIEGLIDEEGCISGVYVKNRMIIKSLQFIQENPEKEIKSNHCHTHCHAARNWRGIYP